MNEITAEDFQKICRACLNESKHMISLCSGENLKMFEACVSVQVCKVLANNSKRTANNDPNVEYCIKNRKMHLQN